MTDSELMRADVLRGRKYAFWKFTRRAIIVLGLVSGAASVVWAFVGIASIFFNLGIESGVLAMVSLLSSTLTFLMVPIYSPTSKQGRKYIHPKFKQPSYDLTLSSLRKLGVKRPIRYLYEHPEHVVAYLSVRKMAKNVVYAPDAKSTVISTIRYWNLKPDTIEAHKVAALVFPGKDELARLPRIKHIIYDRGIRTYSEIKEMVEQVDDIPSVLTEGSL